MNAGKFWRLHAVLAALALSSGPAAAQFSTGCVPDAHTFCVTSTADDATDPVPGQGSGTLRQAIVDANAAGGASTIAFAIASPPQGPYAIALQRQLPALNASTLTSLTIDGFSQPGSAANTNAPDQGGLNAQLMIEIVGTGSIPGFFYGGTSYFNLTVQGLAMHGFTTAVTGQSASLMPRAKLSVYGCYFGTTIVGTPLPAPGNSGAAVSAGYDDAQIGGRLPWQRNLLSGSGTGVYAGGVNASVVIEGNLIGTDATGTQAIPNGLPTNWPGLLLQGDLAGIRVGCGGSGCLDANSRNVISGNHTYGIGIWDSANANTGAMRISGNFIGTDWSGAHPLANGDATAGCPTYCGGIQLQGSTNALPASVIGGFNPGEGNVIAYNSGAGIVSAFDRVGESFDLRGNAIHHNAGTDIVFALVSGRIANDANDADAGANNHQNYPVVLAASLAGNQMSVTYRVDSATANAAYPLRVDFYTDIDEGSGTYLGSDSYGAVDAQASRTVTLTVPAGALPLAGFVATATDAQCYSSEFSPSVVFDRIFASRFEP